MPLTVIDHPLARHYLTHLRDESTEPALFRALARKITTLLAIEATRNLRTKTATIRTPLAEIESQELADEVVVVPILRAGLGMLESIVELLPEVSIGYIGLERDEETAVASSYYRKLPSVKKRAVFLVDPMLATGGSAVRALTDIRSLGAERITLICVVAAPEGVRMVESSFPDVQIFTAALDSELNARTFIVPGLGDFGDRLYGTI